MNNENLLRVSCGTFNQNIANISLPGSRQSKIRMLYKFLTRMQVIKPLIYHFTVVLSDVTEADIVHHWGRLVGIRHIFSALINISNETSGGPFTSCARLFLLEAGASYGCWVSCRHVQSRVELFSFSVIVLLFIIALIHRFLPPDHCLSPSSLHQHYSKNRLNNRPVDLGCLALTTQWYVIKATGYLNNSGVPPRRQTTRQINT